MTVKIGGRVVPGTVTSDPRTLDLRFTVVDIASGKTRFPVQYNGPVPDTFEEGRDVVVTGRYTAEGTFEATELLTKCGSRYEAAEGDFRA
jgi:cytochrome c-type biogenesis protein CcmE